MRLVPVPEPGRDVLALLPYSAGADRLGQSGGPVRQFIARRILGTLGAVSAERARGSRIAHIAPNCVVAE
eukprot:5685167-Pyramimonas_sp.AAC.1